MRIAQSLDGIVSTEDGAAIMLARGASSEPDAYDNGGYCGDDENGDHDDPFVVLVYPRWWFIGLIPPFGLGRRSSCSRG